MQPKKTDLLETMMNSVKNLQREFKKNIERLGGTVNDNNVKDSTLQNSNWNQIIRIKEEQEGKAKLFLLEKEKGLLDEIESAYKSIDDYNTKIIELQYIVGMTRTEDYNLVNSVKEQMREQLEGINRKFNLLLRFR